MPRDVSEPNYVQRTWRLFWPNLAMILVSSVIVCVGAIAIELVVPGPNPLGLLLWGVIVGPLFAVLVAQVNDAFCSGDDPPVFSFFSYLRRTWKLGLAFGVVPAAAAALFLVALEVAGQTNSWIALIPAMVSGCVTVLACFAYLVALPLAFELPALRGRSLVLTSMYVLARRPLPILAVVAVIAIIVWVAAQFSVALVLVLPAPLALVLVSAVWTSAHRVGIDPHSRE